MGKLNLTVMRAENLTDYFENIDVYLKLRCGPKEFRTAAVRSTSTAGWHEHFSFYMSSTSCNDIHIDVMSTGIFSDSLVAQCIVPVADLKKDEMVLKLLKLAPAKGKSGGGQLAVKMVIDFTIGEGHGISGVPSQPQQLAPINHQQFQQVLGQAEGSPAGGGGGDGWVTVNAPPCATRGCRCDASPGFSHCCKTCATGHGPCATRVHTAAPPPDSRRDERTPGPRRRQEDNDPRRDHHHHQQQQQQQQQQHHYQQQQQTRPQFAPAAYAVLATQHYQQQPQPHPTHSAVGAVAYKPVHAAQPGLNPYSGGGYSGYGTAAVAPVQQQHQQSIGYLNSYGGSRQPQAPVHPASLHQPQQRQQHQQQQQPVFKNPYAYGSSYPAGGYSAAQASQPQQQKSFASQYSGSLAKMDLAYDGGEHEPAAKKYSNQYPGAPGGIGAL